MTASRTQKKEPMYSWLTTAKLQWLHSSPGGRVTGRQVGGFGFLCALAEDLGVGRALRWAPELKFSQGESWGSKDTLMGRAHSVV